MTKIKEESDQAKAELKVKCLTLDGAQEVAQYFIDKASYPKLIQAKNDLLNP